MFEGFSHRTVNVGDAEISCVIGGSGPPLLLLHGFPQNKAMWARVAPKLATSHTVVCADLRGYGDSSKPRCLADNSNYAFRAMAGDQLNLMRALGFDRFHLIGHDRGGRTGHRMALDHPDTLVELASPLAGRGRSTTCAALGDGGMARRLKRCDPVQQSLSLRCVQLGEPIACVTPFPV